MHGRQLIAPSWSWKVPAGHFPHDPASVSLLNVPGEHGVSAPDLVGQNVSAEQTMQLSTLSITINALLRRPS
eukprot:3819491-Rhodomonas_salina.1